MSPFPRHLGYERHRTVDLHSFGLCAFCFQKYDIFLTNN